MGCIPCHLKSEKMFNLALSALRVFIGNSRQMHHGRHVSAELIMNKHHAETFSYSLLLHIETAHDNIVHFRRDEGTQSKREPGMRKCSAPEEAVCHFWLGDSQAWPLPLLQRSCYRAARQTLPLLQPLHSKSPLPRQAKPEPLYSQGHQ